MQCLGPNPRYAITFTEGDAASIPPLAADEALIITTDIGVFEVRRVLVDNGSSTDILYYDMFRRMGIDQRKLVQTNAPFIGFNGGVVYPKGAITPPFQLGTNGKTASCTTTFLVGDVHWAYNAIMGRPMLNALRLISPPYHQILKFPTTQGTGMVYKNH